MNDSSIDLQESEVNEYFLSNQLDQFQGPRYNSNMEIVPYSVVGPSTLFDLPHKRLGLKNMKSSLISTNSIFNHETTTRLTSKRNNNLMNHNSMHRKLLPNMLNVNYETITNDDVMRMYENFQKSRNTIKENKIPNLPITIKEALNSQERFFTTFSNHEKKTHSLSKIISFKIKKKEEELLMNKSPAYRIKTELYDIIDINKPKTLSSDLNHWMNTLRRGKPSFRNSLGTNWVQICNSKNKELVYHDRESKPKSIDIIRPCFLEKSLPSLETYSRSKLVYSVGMKYGVDIKKFSNVNNIKVEGKNLLDEEMNQTNLLKGKKLLFRSEKTNKNVNEVIKLQYDCEKSTREQEVRKTFTNSFSKILKTSS